MTEHYDEPYAVVELAAMVESDVLLDSNDEPTEATLPIVAGPFHNQEDADAKVIDTNDYAVISLPPGEYKQIE